MSNSTEVMPATQVTSNKICAKVDIRSTIIATMLTFGLGYYTAASQPSASATSQPPTSVVSVPAGAASGK